jgi:hypothetical protein
MGKSLQKIFVARRWKRNCARCWGVIKFKIQNSKVKNHPEPSGLIFDF